jgi:hypothetical protein
MGGGSKPGEFVEMKVEAKFGEHVIMRIVDEEQREYLEKGVIYVGNITPKPE